MISLLSLHYFSGEETARLFLPVLRGFFAFATRRELYLMHEGIRKLAHVLEFGLFSLAVFHGIRAERRGWKLEWAIITLVVSASHAGLDEWHQSFVPLREARLHDVLIDTPGAFLHKPSYGLTQNYIATLLVGKQYGSVPANANRMA